MVTQGNSTLGAEHTMQYEVGPDGTARLVTAWSQYTKFAGSTPGREHARINQQMRK